MGSAAGANPRCEGGRFERCAFEPFPKYVRMITLWIWLGLVSVLILPNVAVSEEGATIGRMRRFVLSPPDKPVSPYAEFVINVDPARVGQPFRARAFRATREQLISGGVDTGDGCRLFDSV